MKACVFFGHRDDNYCRYKERIVEILIDLIENYGVTQFYSGGRGNFDKICSELVCELKSRYPHIRSTLILSYRPKGKTQYLSEKYDDSIYFLETPCLPRFAIYETNKLVIDKSDFVITGVWKQSGGAWRAKKYAERRKKIIIDVYQESV